MVKFGSTDDLQFFNGYGGFEKSGEGYRIVKKELPPMPWINCISCISGRQFGFTVSESGGGFVWNDNSHENRLTPWYSRPVEDPSGEMFEIACASLPVASYRTSAEVLHGFGYSVFYWKTEHFTATMTVFVPRDEPVKISLFQISVGSSVSSINMKYTVRPVMESSRGFKTPLMLGNTELGEDYVLLDGKMFLAASPMADSPERYYIQEGYSSVLNFDFRIKPESSAEFVFLLGAAEDGYSDMIRKYRNVHECLRELEQVKAAWNKYLSAIAIETPDKALNTIVNGWLLYQVTSCRINTRSGYYQSGGAYGFRDQLQDSLALLLTNPARTRELIILHAQHQYQEGDVQHWWHMPRRGLRTKCSDDMLWLVYVTCRYVTVTGDNDILNEQIPFLVSPPLEAAQEDRYETPDVSDYQSSLYEHCKRAIKAACRLGKHGLPLMRGGDWNDGMNNIGKNEIGESVWLGWFLCSCLDSIASLAKMQKIDADDIRAWSSLSSEIACSIEKYAWEGDRYLRAFDDSGMKIGSASSKECSIDSISQSWSVISGKGTSARCLHALKTAESLLVDYDKGIIKLLTPPFTRSSAQEADPGYISAYPPGVRENGGQYTHAAVWLAKAELMCGNIECGYKYIQCINPIFHTITKGEANTYKAEPYAVAADIYTGSGNYGRAGWSWYTGSASWFYNVIIENLLGISKKGNTLYISLNIPEAWSLKGGYTFKYAYKSSLYIIHARTRGASMSLELIDDGTTHEISI